jgi:hypothetical protein
MQLMLNQFPRDSPHVSMLICKDLLEEFYEREFLFGIQSVSYVSHLGTFLCGQ